MPMKWDFFSFFFFLLSVGLCAMNCPRSPPIQRQRCGRLAVLTTAFISVAHTRPLSSYCRVHFRLFAHSMEKCTKGLEVNFECPHPLLAANKS